MNKLTFLLLLCSVFGPLVLAENLEKPAEDHDDNALRKTRAAKQGGKLVGGVTQQTPDSTEAKELLKKSLTLFDADSGHPNKLKIKKILSYTTQVVAGTKSVIKAELVASDCEKSTDKDAEECGELTGAESRICEFTIWDRPWLPDGKETTVKCENEPKEHKYRSKRAITSEDDIARPLVGGVNQESPDSAEAKDLLKKSLVLFDADSGHPNKLKIKKILSYTTQVVAGTKSVIKAELVASDCEKSTDKDAEECGELTGAETRICEFTIWDRPWLPNGKETTVKCENEPKEHKYRSKREIRENNSGLKLLGAPVAQPLDHPKALRYVQDGLQYLDSANNEHTKLKIDKILSVTKQIVSGQKWNIQASVVLSECSKWDNRESNECSQLEGAQPKICYFEIWDQPWLPKGKQTQIKCDDDDKGYEFRAKRSLGEKYSIPSSFDSNSPNPEVFDFVQAALDYLDSHSGYDTSYALKEIIKASKQTVSGKLWHIKAAIGISDCVKNSNAKFCEPKDLDTKICNLKIWEQPWLGPQKQINITCENDNMEYSFVHNPDAKQTSVNAKHLFQKFMQTHQKQYDSLEEFDRRFRVFKSNLKIIDQLNRNEQGTGQYGVTKFADMTPEEFSASHGLRQDLRSENEIPFTQAKIPDIELPTEFDWRAKKVVTKVKNQGQCGSCWAFSVTGNVEGQYAIKNGNLLEFSEQELVDCDTTDDGCNGGLMDNAYRMIEKLGGLELEGDYPYEAEDEKCHFNKNKVRVQLSGAVNISTDETEMAKWLVANGPISIAINANAMQFYVGGVSHPWKFLCNPKNLDHGVLIVGFGVHKYPLFNKTMPYWIVKNSWGPSWGEQGYYRVFRGDGTCGVNQTPSSAILA